MVDRMAKIASLKLKLNIDLGEPVICNTTIIQDLMITRDEANRILSRLGVIGQVILIGCRRDPAKPSVVILEYVTGMV